MLLIHDLVPQVPRISLDTLLLGRLRLHCRPGHLHVLPLHLVVQVLLLEDAAVAEFPGELALDFPELVVHVYDLVGEGVEAVAMLVAVFKDALVTHVIP